MPLGCTDLAPDGKWTYWMRGNFIFEREMNVAWVLKSPMAADFFIMTLLVIGICHYFFGVSCTTQTTNKMGWYLQKETPFFFFFFSHQTLQVGGGGVDGCHSELLTLECFTFNMFPKKR